MNSKTNLNHANVLFLSNGAPNYFVFFNQLAERLSNNGCLVHFAVDCLYTKDLNNLDQTVFPVHVFSSFFSEFEEDVGQVLLKYDDMPLNAALLSDFERAEIYKFGKNRDTTYYCRLQAALLIFFEKIINEYNIKFVVYENVSNAFAHFAWFVCQKLGVTYVGIGSSRLPGRFSIVDNPMHEHDLYMPLVESIRTGAYQVPPTVREWSRKYLDNLESIVPDYMKFNNLDKLDLINRYLNKEKLGKLKMIARHLEDSHVWSFQVGNPAFMAFQMVRRSVYRKLKWPLCKKYYSEEKEGEIFLLYPLHYHPESSTSIQAGAYLNEYEVIRNIAFSLPAGLILYVKDHVSAFAYPSLDFYKKLAKLPNVKLISPFANTKNLIRKCAAVITLTSTVGYEALMMNKRVFVYGDVFYKLHPNAVVVKNTSELFEILKFHISKDLNTGPDYNVDFVSAYYLKSFDGVLNLTMNSDETELLLDKVFPQIKMYMEGCLAE